METAWSRASGQLSVANGEEFERTALHYLRILWPSMIQAPRMQRLDTFGVDLCVPGTEGHFEVVIQTKGFKVDEELLASQVKNQIKPSIEKFRRSPLTCDKYVLLHNRDGANRVLAEEIQKALDNLVRQGKAKSAQLWDRSAFIKQVRNRIDVLIREKLSERSTNLLRQHERYFYFGNIFVPKVPLAQFTWKPGSKAQQEFPSGVFRDTDAAHVVSSPGEVRYAMLIGSFGIGKTTTVLHAADTKGRVTVYVPAHTIRRAEGSQGTNYLLRNLSNELDLLEDLPADTAEVLGDLLGAGLGRILRQPSNEFVLVIDGLDEHSFYGTAAGLQWLANELAELRCPIVLSTRKEHFLALIGNYDLAAQTLSKKGGAARVVNVLELGSWSTVQAKALLQQVLEEIQDEGHIISIQQLLDKLSADGSSLSVKLLSHPLFLQMTIDLIIDGEDLPDSDEDKLLELWLRKKIQRDFVAPRFSTALQLDVEQYVDAMLCSMKRVAAEMNAANGEAGGGELLDFDRLVDIVRATTRMPDLEPTAILTTSLMIPASRRRGRILQVQFFHKAIKDFFERYECAAA